MGTADKGPGRRDIRGQGQKNVLVPHEEEEVRACRRGGCTCPHESPWQVSQNGPLSVQAGGPWFLKGDTLRAESTHSPH